MKSLIVIISNPAARKSSVRKIESTAALLTKKGFSSEIFLTKKRGDAEHLARKAREKKPFLIIAAGGDGTINEVINGLVWSEIPLAVLPLGTTNVLAKELAIPEHIDGAVETALSKTPKRICLGTITLLEGSSRVSRYFSLMAGIGFDGKAVRDVNWSLKKVSGKAAYVMSGLKNFVFYSPEKLTLKTEGRDYAGYCAVVGNARKYGGHFSVTPDSSVLDPRLHMCIFEGKKRSDLLRYVFGVVRGTHLRNDDVIYVTSEHIEIKGRAYIQVDGDYFGTTPAEISIAKDAVRIVF